MFRLFKWFLPILLLLPLNASASEMGPSETLKEAIRRMKESNSLLVATEYTHWESAFKHVPDHYKRKYKLLTHEDYRLHITMFFAEPDKMLSKILSGPTHALDPEMKAKADAYTKKLSKEFERRIRAVYKRLINAKYQVGNAKISGNNASVPLRITLEGQIDDDFVPFVKVDDKWLMPKVVYFEHYEDTLPDPMSIKGLLERGIP